MELSERDYEVIEMVKSGRAHLRRRRNEVTAYEHVPESPTSVHAIRAWQYEYAEAIVEACQAKVYLSNTVL